MNYLMHNEDIVLDLSFPHESALFHCDKIEKPRLDSVGHNLCNNLVAKIAKADESILRDTFWV